MSGLKWRINDLFETYSTVRGWTDEAKIIQFSTSGPLPIPILIEQFLMLVVGLVDTLMVSYAGEAAVSGGCSG